MAFLSDCEYPPPPQEFEVRSTPILVAYSIDLMASEVEPPHGPKKRIPTIFTFQQTPVIPTPLFPTAPIVPAQWVP